jgi:hypothetical protein
MGKKNLSFFEYMNMLENEYKEFSPQKLLILGTRIAESEFGKYGSYFKVPKFNKYGQLLEGGLSMLKKVIIDRESVSGPEVDEQQKNVVYASNKLCNKLDFGNPNDAGLISIIVTISGTIDYFKTLDPLYMIEVWRGPAIYDIEASGEDLLELEQYGYYEVFKSEFKDQIELLWRLKGRLGI